jgi:ATP-binding cassette, subfamily B, bacterial
MGCGDTRLHHVVFTFLPVAAELGTILVVLTGLAPPVFLLLFCGALGFYAAAFACAVTTIASAARSASAVHVDSNSTMIDGLLRVETVKYFTAESFIQERVSCTPSRTESEWIGF